LSGDDIPCLARIVSLANTFVNLTAGEQSQESMALDDAKTYIRHQAGELFDPALSEIFLKIVR
jgi:response regulator RpfG family c-di-GMP phosphodiesterase